MSKTLHFSNLPAGISSCEGTLDVEGDWHCANITFELGGSELSLDSTTDVVLIIDASFSMFARAYRNGRIFDLVEQIMKFVAPFDDDGVDIYFHSLRAEPFKYIGAHADADALHGHLADYVEARTAARIMGQKTILVPALDDVIQRLKEEKGSERVFVEVITDGVFDDEEELERKVIAYGQRYNSDENPYGLRFHFTGVGAQGAKGLAFLERLDDGLEDEVDGWIDCVEFHHADSVEENVNAIVGELKSTLQLAASNGIVAVEGSTGKAAQLCRTAGGKHDPTWESGPEMSLEEFPPLQSYSALFSDAPDRIDLKLFFVNDTTGDVFEETISATVG